LDNCLLIGSPDSEGETTDCFIDISLVEREVTFIDFDNDDDKPKLSMPFVLF